MTSADDDRGPRVHLAAGLNQAQQAEARRVFAALNTTRAQRHEQAAASGSAQPLPLCATLLSNAELCLRVLVDEQECPHREPGPAPAALAERFTALRADVVEARELACVLASLTRCYHGDRGVSFAAARIGRQLPRWLEPGEPGWPPT